MENNKTELAEFVLGIEPNRLEAMKLERVGLLELRNQTLREIGESEVTKLKAIEQIQDIDIDLSDLDEMIADEEATTALAEELKA